MSGPKLSRRRTLGVGLGAASAAVLPGCSAGTQPGAPGDAPAGGWPAHIPPPVLEGGQQSSVPGVPPLYLKPIIQYRAAVPNPPGDGAAVTTIQILWGAPPQPPAQNKWLQELNRRLNILYEPQLAPATRYGDQFSTMLASGKLPDLVFTQDNTPQGLQAIVDGGLLDLTERLSGEGIKRWPNLANIRTETWQASSKNGRIYGIPNENSPLSKFPSIRADVLQTVGATSLGKTPEEMRQVLTEMGRLGKVKGKQFWVFGDLGDMTTVVEWMYGIGPEWQLDESGKLRSKFQHPRYPEVINYLRSLWDAKTVFPDPAGQKPPESLQNGQSGFGFDSYNGYFLNPIVGQIPERTPGAAISFFVPPVAADAKLTIQRDDGYWSVVGIAATITDTGRQDRLLDVLNWFRSPFGSEEYLFINRGIEGIHYTVDSQRNVVATKDSTAFDDMSACNWLGVSPVNGNFVIDSSLAAAAEQFYPVYEKLVQATVPNPIAGLYSEIASKSDGKRSDTRTDFINGMMYGRRPVTDYPKFVADWLSAGGQAALEDYQKAYDRRLSQATPASTPS